MHEAYFFNSTLLVDHIKRAQGRPALFEVAAKAGLIVPAFRDPNTESLDQAFELMKGEYGHDYVLLRPEVQPFKNRILAAIDIGLEKTKPFYWPTPRTSARGRLRGCRTQHTAGGEPAGLWAEYSRS